MKKYAFFQYDMGLGGIQNSLFNLLTNLDYTDLSVDLYLFSHENFRDPDKGIEELLPAGVTVRYIDPGPKYLKYIPFDEALSRLTPALTAAFPEDVYYDCAIDFNSYQPECAAGAILVPSAKRVEWVHNDIAVKLKNEWKYRVLHFFFREKFKFFEEFVCVSQGITESFRNCSIKFMNEDATVRVIPNYIDTEEINSKKKEPVEDLRVSDDYLNLVTTGRLCHQKGYDLMLRELQKASQLRDSLSKASPEQYPPLRLYLIGDGPDRDKLEKLASELGLKETGREQVIFTGRKSNPFNIMEAMDAFISTSRYEGQGMNILEAMVIGLPLYCTKNLEQYVEGLKGCEDISEALAHAKKQPHIPDDLQSYRCGILTALRELG